MVDQDVENNLITIKPPDFLPKGAQTLDLAEGTTNVTMERTTLKDVRIVTSRDD